MLDYKLLEALVSVVQEGGFDKAAQSLCLTQSAVSQRIKQLEEQIGQTIIARTNPPKATKAGQKIVKHFLQIRRLEDDLFESIAPQDYKEFVTLSIGTNRDCLATWLHEALQGFLNDNKVVIEFCAADQEQTHRLMRDGDVMGCISVKNQAMQGCKIEYLGKMKYWLVAAPAFISKWFSKGISYNSIQQAPLIRFDRKDEMHIQFFQNVMDNIPDQLPTYFLPSTRTYAEFIYTGLAYGLLPEQECRDLLATGGLVNLFPNTPLYVELYWHCWNLKSKLLEKFSKHLVINAGKTLFQ